MPITLSQLKSVWLKEKDAYIKQEVGSGVQKFVKNVFKSEDLFCLEEGLVSTASEKRKNEFTEESKTKAARKADVIIYINPEIIIPVEVEKFGNIQAGLDQLFQYQLDLQKKYGILTDGYTWRFYNNSFLVKEYNLDQMLAESSIFKEFWHEYIKPEYYYLSFFEERGQLSLLPEDLSVEYRRQDFFVDITTLIRGFQKKLKIEGYLTSLGTKEGKKVATEITYAYIIQFILYKTLVDNAFDDFPGDFKQREEGIYESLKAKQYGNILGVIGGISDKISKNIYKPFKKEQEFINDKLDELLFKPKNELHDVSPWLDIFVFIKKYAFANVKNDIFGFIYENYLKELYQETQKGQYFTDPAVVNFMLDQIGYTKEEIQKRAGNKPEEESISIIDPSCGSGTFLYSATDRIIEAIPDGTLKASEKVEEVVNQNVFGLDIEEFPLYLAEMNILMRMLPLIVNEKYNNPIDKKIKIFKTRDSIAEFINTGLKNTINDIDVAGGQRSLFDAKKLDLEYHSFMRQEGDLEDMKESMRPPRRRFDYVIGNPPYIGYNECSRQNVMIFNLMKQGKVKLNDIYGVNLHSTPVKPKRYRPNPNLYAFFLALGIALLKQNGKLCFIIPQTILVNPDYDVLRFHLSRYTTIEKIISFSGKMFTGRGIKQSKPVATSSLILVIKKDVPSITHQVEVASITAKNADNGLPELVNSPTFRTKKIMQAKLAQNIINWNFINQSSDFIDFHEIYTKNTENFLSYSEHILSKSKYGNNFFFDGGYDIDEKQIKSMPYDGILNYRIPSLFGASWAVNKFIGYWPNIRTANNNLYIKLRQGSQGYSLLDSKYKIVWSYNNTKKFAYTDQSVIWSRNKLLAIGSQNQDEIFYLFAILNSEITNLVLENLVKVSNEDSRTILVSLQTIKEQIRLPIISESNQATKREIFSVVRQLLENEKSKLSDFVNFSSILRQQFSDIKVNAGELVLIYGDRNNRCEIKRNQELVKESVKNILSDKELFSNKPISLSVLKNLPVVDYKKQKQIKDYIDDLVFALYFNVPIKKLGLEYAAQIKKSCAENKFYKIGKQ